MTAEQGQGESARRTSLAAGYRMPAEWQPHGATWLAWPHNETTWPGQLDAVQALWVEMMRALRPGECVHVLVPDAATAAMAAAMVGDADAADAAVSFHMVPTDDAWIRDTGPTFVMGRSGVAAVTWRFDAWGGKYPPWERDAAVSAAVAALAQVPRFAPGVVLEGGSVDVNGLGTVLTTEACLLARSRNPGLGRAEMERVLHEYLGANHVVWLGDGIAGDDTDGHVDDMARFVGPRTVLCAIEQDPADPNHAPLRDNYERLRSAVDQDGRPLRVVPLPMPEPLCADGERLPASYANFYIANHAVLVPVFGQGRDAQALAVLRDLFPHRRVIGLDASVLVVGLGAFHCVTQQQPAGV